MKDRDLYTNVNVSVSEDPRASRSDFFREAEVFVKGSSIDWWGGTLHGFRSQYTVY